MSNSLSLQRRLTESFRNQFSHDPELIVLAPGRANIIGEHTDYNDGHVLPIAIDRYVAAAAANRDDSTCRLHTVNLDESFEFDRAGFPGKRPHWVSYMMGVIAELKQDGFEIRGKEIAVLGDLPIGSGLSSSAALEIATATAVERLERLQIDDARLVNICRRADHNFVGIKSGPMDQFASRACRAGYAGLLDCRSLQMTDQRLPDNIVFLSIYSGIPRALAVSEYNERQNSCRQAVEVLQQENPEIVALRDATPGLVDAKKIELGERVFRRARHVVTEQARVFKMIRAFEENNISRVGEVLLEGHRSLSIDYEVSVPVLDEMIEWICRKPGIIGARLTGAGFGGSMICLADAALVDEENLAAEFVKAFRGRTPESPELWRLVSVEGARYRPSIKVEH